MENAWLQNQDVAFLSKLNHQFIQNFLTQDVAAHDRLIHHDFICIESDGRIVQREEYLKAWATDFDNSGYTSFLYCDEFIRVFGNMALVRAKTIFTKGEGDEAVKGYTIYTDTYVKEDGTWKCVQVQITLVK